MKYEVATNSTVKGLTDDVRKALDDGWELQGGVAVGYAPEFGPVFLQALVTTQNKEKRSEI